MTFRINPFTGELDFYDVTKYTSSTGVASGGVLSIDVSNTTFSITAGTGTYVDSTTNAVTNVIWAAVANIPVTYLLTNLVTYVAITPTGTVLQQVSPFTNSQSRDNIILGAVVHTNLTTINAVNQTQHVILNPANQVADLQNSLGFFNVSGNIYSPNGTNLNLNKSAGVVHKTGSNWDIDQKNPNVKTLASGTAITFRYRLQNGTELANTTVVDPSNYDVAGVLTSVPLGKFTVQRINVFSSNITRVQYGQNLYNGLSDALAAIQTEIFITETNIAQNGLLRGFLVVRGLATDLTSSNTYFLEAPKFGGVGGIGGLSTTTMQGAYDNSTTPEIVTSTTNGAISIKRGSTADTDAVIEIQNGAGSNTASITGAGVITGSNLSGINTGDESRFVTATNTSTPNATVPVVSLTAVNVATDVDFTFSPKGTGAFTLSVADNTATGGAKRGTNSIDLQTTRTTGSQVASGTSSFVAGRRNLASGITSVALGDTNTSSGNKSFSVGSGNTASGTSSVCTGENASNFSIYGRFTHGAGVHQVQGDCQRSIFVLRQSTTNATPGIMTSGATGQNAASGANQLIVQNNSAISFTGMIAAKQSASTNSAAWKIEGLIVRGTTAASTTVVASTVTVVSNVPTWGTPTLTADTTLGGLNITVTGLAATNIRWTCTFDTTEVIYA